jgi:predicted transcriptional regulator
MEHATSSHAESRTPNNVAGRVPGPRHSILDLAPLELECLSALWPMGEATVRDIHRQLNLTRIRAYTTVLTIMDRLAQKGIVGRRKLGRAYWYQANLSADEARWKAVEKIVAGFFDGSKEALVAHLSSQMSFHAPQDFAKVPVTDQVAKSVHNSAALRNAPPVAATMEQTVIEAVETTATTKIPEATETTLEELHSQELDDTLL